MIFRFLFLKVLFLKFLFPGRRKLLKGKSLKMNSGNLPIKGLFHSSRSSYLKICLRIVKTVLLFLNFFVLFISHLKERFLPNSLCYLKSLRNLAFYLLHFPNYTFLKNFIILSLFLFHLKIQPIIISFLKTWALRFKFLFFICLYSF